MLSGEANAGCSREESFDEIYEAMGDVQAQEKIRKASPEKGHCKLLTNPRFGASFCTQCPNNPRLEIDLKTGQPNARAELMRLIETYRGVADDVLGLAMHVRYGMMPILESHIEIELVVLACYELEAAAERRGQDHLAQRIAEMMAAMFGGKA